MGAAFWGYLLGAALWAIFTVWMGRGTGFHWPRPGGYIPWTIGMVCLALSILFWPVSLIIVAFIIVRELMP